MIEIIRCKIEDYPALADIWESAVRATHTFLSEDDIREIRAALIPQYFPNVELYGIVVGSVVRGFVGLSGKKIEMLFVDDRYRGKGLGSRLMAHAISLGANMVDVNEQNPQALGFYKAKGFCVMSRDECDDAGRPFPILHMSLMKIRPYRYQDLDEIIKLFYNTVHNVNIRDYTREQVDAWATGTVDAHAWHESLSRHHAFVAVADTSIIGFGDIDENGYLDRLYVHHEHQHQGVATALCRHLEAAADVQDITVHASITAVPFFKERGYEVVVEQHVIRNGVALRNYVMQLKKV